MSSAPSAKPATSSPATANVLPGDFIALCTAGAYGFVLASNYNTRPRPAEVLVEGASWKFIRARETYDDLVRGEE
jgi:diaminopimelate decarboxylase